MDQTFAIIDYLLLSSMLLVSLIVGLYYAFFKTQNTAEEYLHGGKSMNYIAVSLSITSSVLSGVSLISLPTEIYYYGSQYILCCITMFLVAFTTYYWTLPIFYKLQLTSIFTYFELRFNSRVKLFSSVLFAIQMILYLPIVIYVPGLAVAQVTNINLHFITPIICFICILYTIFGGIKAVIWTDALQFFVMLGSTITVLVLGIIRTGGIKNVFGIAYDTGRLYLDFSLDPTKRDTFWTSLIGTYPHLLALVGLTQGTVQKYLSLKDYKDVKRTQLVSTIGMTFIYFLCGITGLVVLAQYVYCDPLTNSEIKKPDQILPYYVMDLGASVPGLSGLFVAGVISAGLSTLSAALNSLAATTYNDFLKNLLPEKMVTRYEAPLLKFLVGLIGFVCVCLVYVVEYLGNVLPLFISFIGLTNGPMLGLFVVGMFIPKVNSKGALWGGITSLLFLGWLVLLSQWYKMTKLIKYPTLPVYTNHCIESNTSYSHEAHEIPQFDEVFWIYKISHHYYPLIGVIVVIVVSCVVSSFTKHQFVHDDLLSPVVRYFRRHKGIEFLTYKGVDQVEIKEGIESNTL